jgi:glycosyltransferase involved in cell wall biosynthesis
VSINVTVYNHEHYIERCLRSIAAQKVDFPYEVLIGEDCSTDGTREVLRKLEDELPDCFKFLYREHNLGGRGEGNATDLLYRSKGKYLALLEGDDFWTYDGKLQAQAEFLESHPDYEAVYSRCTVVDAKSQPSGEIYPECCDEDYSFEEFFLCALPGQIGTSLIRLAPYLPARERFLELSLYDSYAGDRRYAFILLSLGKIRCIQEQWSAYRHVVSSGTSYSATVNVDDEYARNEVLFGKTLVRYAADKGDVDALWVAKETYYRTLLKWSHGKIAPFDRRECMRELRREPHWLRLRLCPLRWYAALGMRQLRGRGVTL